MAYANKDQSKRVKAELTKEFPGYKFSVTVENYSSIVVSIMAAPVVFTHRPYEQLNHFYLERYQNSEILKRIKSIANKGNYDKSDAMTDYFEVGFYLNINVGKWDKPFTLLN
jgi:hypothetical protein